MPALNRKKSTRPRFAYRRALEKALRAAAKGTGWRSADGCIFREVGPWFVSVFPSVLIYEETTKCRCSAKPMSIDPVFWDLVGMPENKTQPLSFRMSGAFVCRPPDFAEREITEDPDPTVVAERILQFAKEQLSIITHSWSPDAFLAHCQAALDKHDEYLPCVISSLIDQGRESEALEICERAQKRDQHGGFLFPPQGGFPQVAAAWIRREQKNPNAGNATVPQPHMTLKSHLTAAFGFTQQIKSESAKSRQPKVRLTPKERKAKFELIETLLAEKARSYGFQIRPKTPFIARSHGSFEDVLWLENNGRAGAVFAHIGLDCPELLIAETTRGFYFPVPSIFTSYLSAFSSEPTGGYRFDYPASEIASAAFDDFVRVGLPIYEAATLVETYDPLAYLHPALSKGFDRAVPSLYFSRGKIDEGIVFLRGLRRLGRTYFNDEAELRLAMDSVSRGVRFEKGPIEQIAELFYRYHIDPAVLF